MERIVLLGSLCTKWWGSVEGRSLDQPMLQYGGMK
jgi:hypothetical protein